MGVSLDGNVGLAFGLTFFAGLATAVGAAIAFLAKRTDYRVLAFGLSFSAGVMLYVSFVEILGKAGDALAKSMGERGGAWATAGGFFAGILVVGIIDRFVPKVENPHEPPTEDELHRFEDRHAKVPTGALLRMGKLAALAIAIHNFPEGMATFLGAWEDPAVGVAIAVAIALHNIPEGVAVSVPIFYATGSRGRAFWLAALSGMAEPVGALIGYVLLRPYFTPTLQGLLFASVAGIMVFVSLDELLPTARLYARGHETVYGIVGGMGMMALSLLLFK